jgi:hypothetical protein
MCSQLTVNGLEQILLQNFKKVLNKLSEKYFFLKNELSKSNKKTKSLKNWLSLFFKSRKQTQSNFCSEFIKRFQNIGLNEQSYCMMCEEIENDLITEINSFRERLQYSELKAVNDIKKVKKKYNIYRDQTQMLVKIIGNENKTKFGLSEILQYIEQLEKGKIKQGINGFVYLIGFCWQIRLFLQELFEMNTNEKENKLTNSKIKKQKKGNTSVKNNKKIKKRKFNYALT